MVIKPQGCSCILRLVLTIPTKYQPLGENSSAKFPFVLQHLPQVCQVGHAIDRRIIQIHTIQIVKNHRYDLRIGLLRVLREARKNTPPPRQK